MSDFIEEAYNFIFSLTRRYERSYKSPYTIRFGEQNVWFDADCKIKGIVVSDALYNKVKDNRDFKYFNTSKNNILIKGYLLNRIDIYVKGESVDYYNIYIQRIKEFKRGKELFLRYACDRLRHLVCIPYTKRNLFVMADELGIKTHWFHKDHFDIPKRRYEDIKERVNFITAEEVVNIIKGRQKALLREGDIVESFIKSGRFKVCNDEFGDIVNLQDNIGKTHIFNKLNLRRVAV